MNLFTSNLAAIIAAFMALAPLFASLVTDWNASADTKRRVAVGVCFLASAGAYLLSDAPKTWDNAFVAFGVIFGGAKILYDPVYKAFNLPAWLQSLPFPISFGKNDAPPPPSNS